jgi:UDP-N-acetylglucosamine 2-epimerase (non-hydrolysing)
MPYTHRSKENLLREGFARDRVFVTGNPIWEVVQHSWARIEESTVRARLGLEKGGYMVVTAHRAENVDDPRRLANILDGIALVADTFGATVVVSLHPRTADKVKRNGLAPKSSLVRFIEPVGFFDFVRLEQDALCVLTDSGTVQEEATLLKVPNVVLRDVTERAECLEAGSGVLSGAQPEAILACTRLVVEAGARWTPPAEYTQENVSDVVASLVLGHRTARAA